MKREREMRKETRQEGEKREKDRRVSEKER